jgi:protein gp37
MNRTGIAWTDFTWNTNTGCKELSAACDNCYARTTAENKRGTAAFPDGFGLRFWPDRLGLPAKRRKPTKIFAGSMTDFFQVDIPDWQRDALFDAIEAAPQHTFQILTKRPARAWKYFQRRPVPANVWLGTTIESNAHVLRADFLRRIDARVRFISAEPLFDALPNLDLAGIHWLIAGGESGSHLWRADVCAERGLVERVGSRWVPRPDRVEWVRSLRDRCHAAGVAFFFKQWGGPTNKAGGCALDGREWKEFPGARG